MDDNACMKRLVEKAYQVKEPFTALIINEDTHEIIAEGFAKVSKGQPLYHGETDAIQEAVNKVGLDKLLNTNLTLFTTGEPCPMCAGACVWIGVKRVVYGSARPLLCDLGWDDLSMRCEDVFRTAKYTIKVDSVLEDENNKMFRHFQIKNN